MVSKRVFASFWKPRRWPNVRARDINIPNSLNLLTTCHHPFIASLHKILRHTSNVGAGVINVVIGLFMFFSVSKFVFAYHVQSFPVSGSRFTSLQKYIAVDPWQATCTQVLASAPQELGQVPALFVKVRALSSSMRLPKFSID